MSLLQVSNINQYYGGSHILRDVSFEARLGRITVLLGRNGVGKTTLLKSLMGAVPIRNGSITFDGQSIEKSAPTNAPVQASVMCPKVVKYLHD
jgi:urea transport system ATP-binding protein